MNIVNKLTLRHLKTNKGRTIVTILGITVSVAMITAVFVSIASFLDFNGKVTILSGGNSHALFQNITQGQLKVIEKDSRIKSTGITATLQENGFYLEGSSSYRIGSGQVLAGDLQYLRQMVTSGYDGKLPENEHEIAVEEEFIEKNHLKWKPGDRVTLDVGSRFLEQSGEKQLYYGSYLSDEEFTQTGTKDYKITAILHTNIPTQSAQVLRGMSDREKEGNVDAVILLKEVDHKSLDVIKSMVQKYQIQTAEINTDYLETKFAIDENSRVIKAIIPMTGVMLVIIVLASVVLIYNAFGMSLSERVRYLGMLASVGATKRQ
ncbi:FtsX-like permease family protein, partial [Muricomes intestini]